MSCQLIRIAIVDDHTMVRQALQKALTFYPSITVVLESGNGKDLASKLDEFDIDVLLLDVHMPYINGIEVLKSLYEFNSRTRTLVLSAFSDELYVSECLRYGVNGYLTKSMDIEEIVKAIKAAYKNEVYYTNLLSNPLLKHYLVKNKKSMENMLPVFSDDELLILNLLKEEKNTEEISSMLNLSKRAIEIKRDKMRQKANVKTVGGLLLYAQKRNLFW